MATVDSTGATLAPKRERNVGKEISALQGMTNKELRARYAEVFGEETRANNKAWLVKRVAWRIQAAAEGDLSERARERAAELANEADLRLSPPKTGAPTTTRTGTLETSDRLPVPGTHLTREYKRRVHQVEVLTKGFEFEGETYKSLSARSECSCVHELESWQFPCWRAHHSYDTHNASAVHLLSHSRRDAAVPVKSSFRPEHQRPA